MFNKHIMLKITQIDKSHSDGVIKMILGKEKLLLILSLTIVHLIFYVQILLKMMDLFLIVIIQVLNILELIIFSQNAKIHQRITIRANLHNKFKHF